MAVIPDFKRATLLAFLKENVALGSTVYTDGLKSFAGLQEAGLWHVMCLALSPCELISAKAQTRCCLWQTAPLEISSKA